LIFATNILAILMDLIGWRKNDQIILIILLLIDLWHSKDLPCLILSLLWIILFQPFRMRPGPLCGRRVHTVFVAVVCYVDFHNIFLCHVGGLL